jgi:hypothetical protein
MLRGNRQKLSVYGARRIIVSAELLQPLSYTPTPCGIFAVTIYKSATPVMPAPLLFAAPSIFGPQ